MMSSLYKTAVQLKLLHMHSWHWSPGKRFYTPTTVLQVHRVQTAQLKLMQHVVTLSWKDKEIL